MRTDKRANDVRLAAKRIADAGGVLMTMPSLGQRGGERVAAHIANGLARTGIPVRIALLRDGQADENELRAGLHNSVSVRSAGPRLRLPAGRYLERARAVPFIRDQIRSFRPGVVLCSINSLALTTALCRDGSNSGPSFALKLTNPIVPANLPAAWRMMKRRSFEFSLPRFDLAITLSEADRRKALEIYPAGDKSLRTLPNAYVTSDMLDGPTPKRGSLPRILACGAMVRQKRLDLLLRAFALCDSKVAKLTILGDGSLRSDLQDLAQSLEIADRVELVGFTNDVVSWLRQSDLFVLSSDYEGLPAVVLEALACGVPVVSTDSFASAHELLDELKGCSVVPIGNAKCLAKAIDESLNSIADPVALRSVARNYLIEGSVEAHIVELGRVVEAATARGARASAKSLVQSRSTEIAAANDDVPATHHARIIRQIAAVAALVFTGWILHDVAGLPTSRAEASTFVDDAVSIHRAKLISDAMETRPEIVRYDRAALLKATAIHMPRFPARWKVLDVEIIPRPQSVNLAVQAPDGTRLSVFAMKTQARVAGYPVPDKRGRENVVYWGEGDSTFALVGSLPPKALLNLVPSLDPDGPVVSA